MHYYLDGYNILFSLSHSKKSLLHQRKELTLFLQEAFAKKKIRGSLIFDGKVNLEEESGRAYPSPLELVFTSQGETADAYILEQAEFCKHRSQLTVITNDQGLRRHLRYMRVKTMDNQKFLSWLSKEKQKEEKPEIFESRRQTERLLKIFEDNTP
ncbi:MAG: NYN domain-containing protein [Chlamydiia bacterium]|nr:NYN domain-containing protein [Chlamydiia bacterium]